MRTKVRKKCENHNVFHPLFFVFQLFVVPLHPLSRVGGMKFKVKQLKKLNI